LFIFFVISTYFFLKDHFFSPLLTIFLPPPNAAQHCYRFRMFGIYYCIYPAQSGAILKLVSFLNARGLVTRSNSWKLTCKGRAKN
jgi:hypothetical protein